MFFRVVCLTDFHSLIKYCEAGLFRSNTKFIIVITPTTKIIKLSELYLYDIKTGHI